MSFRIINADVMDGLRSLADESVQCVVTSPPYWGLRDYGVDGQIGLEATPAEFVARMVEVFREVRRVLRKDGTCWVNLGDSYAAGKCGRDDEDEKSLRRRFEEFGTGRPKAGRKGANGQARKLADGLKPKDLVGIPWRVAFALQDDGWWLRQDIIWKKPNPMPESVTDRCTKAHEYVFLLTKAARYYWDQEAISEPFEMEKGGRVIGRAMHGSNIARGGDLSNIGGYPQTKEGRNKRSVWTIATAPFSEAHFATFPPELPEICIKAGSKPGDTVLDPFSGAGTTAMVADRLQRHAIGIELNPEYARMSEARLSRDRGGLLDLMEAAE